MKTKLQLYQLVAPLVRLGIWEENFRTGEFYVNDIIREILGVGAEENLTSKETIKFYKNPEILDLTVRRALENPLPIEIELDMVNAKGDNLVVKMIMQASFDEDGCYGIYGTLQNITEEVKRREEKNQLQQLFANAFIHAPIGIALVSLEGRWIETNNSLRQLLGYTEEEIMTKGFQDITHPDDLASNVEALKRLLDNTSTTYTTEKRYFHSSGRIIWVALSVVVVKDDYERPVYFVSHIKDITDQKSTSETIETQNARLIDFAYIVSHNLRSHASNMQMLTKLILDEEKESEKEKCLEMLHTNSINLLNTLSNLNEVVKINDKQYGETKQLNVYSEVDRVLQILSAEISEANAEVSYDIPEQLLVNFYPSYLESILLNLISNAIKYRDDIRPLKIHISTSVKPSFIELTVRDNGKGIDLSLHGDKLFGLYKTFHGNIDAKGLGLFITKNQVEAMGGKVKVTSESGIGSNFTVEIKR